MRIAHDRELDQAHAVMIAVRGLSPSRSTPAQALRDALQEGVLRPTLQTLPPASVPRDTEELMRRDHG